MAEIGIYIYVEGSDLDDVANPIECELTEWLKKSEIEAKIINQKYERDPDMLPEDLTDWDLGLNFKFTDLIILKIITDFVYSLGIKYNRTFILGYFSDERGISQDISHFGYEGGELNTNQVGRLIENVC